MQVDDDDDDPLLREPMPRNNSWQQNDINSNPNHHSNPNPNHHSNPNQNHHSDPKLNTSPNHYPDDYSDYGQGGMNEPVAGNFYQSAPDWLEGLNDEQRKAVETLEGPLLVLAGAGTGKTRVLTTRLAHILHQQRANLGQILCVTFTNKAANEMRERVEKLIGHGTSGMWIGTFHSIAARILRRHADLVGLNKDFTILDTDDQVRLLKQLSKDHNVDPKKWPPRALIHHISRWKDRALSPDQVPKSEYQALVGSSLAALYDSYNQRLTQLNAVDFGDLLVLNIKLFVENEDILSSYQARFHFMLVDEYQDTNVAQYLWLRLLARASGGREGVSNICCVGDDDQSIYGWRGAEVENILRFAKDFEGATIIKLECNYRSTEHILAAASKLIAHNQGRHGKTLWTNAKGGIKVQLRGVWDDMAEASLISQDMQQMRENGWNWSSFAVLVRAGFQTRPFEERFIANGIPYRVIGGLRFYEREEARDTLAYLRLVQSPSDDLAFLRIINKPTRGIGATTQERIRVWANMKQMSLYAAAGEMLDIGEIKGAAKANLTILLTQFANWRKQNLPEQQARLTEIILAESGYLDMWRNSNLPDAQGRIENLGELISAIKEFKSLADFLDHVALVMENETKGGGNYVSLMTLHGAKGLEFDGVYLPGWEEEVFPNPRALNEQGRDGVEEERRLAYVGITRARKRVMITFAAQRRVFGETQATMPSRFIDELPAEHVEKTIANGLYRGASHYQQSYGQARQYAQSKPVKSQSGKNSIGFVAGDRVHHDKFGSGTVRRVDRPHIMVTFDHTGDKLLFEDFLKSIAE